MRLNHNYDQPETEKEDENAAAIAKLTGRIRALEAIILKMPETTYDLIREAKTSLRDEFTNSSDPWTRLKARVSDLVNAPYDKHAEVALDNLAHEVKSKTSCEND